MASIVLLMDLCHNKSSSYLDKQRAEIADALRILEEARHESETAARFLHSLILYYASITFCLRSAWGQKPPDCQ
jgi:hypothetical protein